MSHRAQQPGSEREIAAASGVVMWFAALVALVVIGAKMWPEDDAFIERTRVRRT